MYGLEEILKVAAPLFAAIAAIFSAIAAYNANNISNALKRFQLNTFLNSRELSLLNRILELLKIYEVWCTDEGAGSDVNFHESKDVSYGSRDDAWSQIPRDIKFTVIQLSSHSDRLEMILTNWESEFIRKINNTYMLNDKLVKEKIKSLREIIVSGI